MKSSVIFAHLVFRVQFSCSADASLPILHLDPLPSVFLPFSLLPLIPVCSRLLSFPPSLSTLVSVLGHMMSKSKSHLFLFSNKRNCRGVDSQIVSTHQVHGQLGGEVLHHVPGKENDPVKRSNRHGSCTWWVSTFFKTRPPVNVTIHFCSILSSCARI